MTAPLISAEELSTLLASGEDMVLLDARPSPDDFAAGHLADAQHAALDTQLSAASDAGADASRGGRHPLPPLERWLDQLQAWGIGPNTRVVVYDAQSGANAAARAWWMLRAVGHDAVSVLDGDFRDVVAPPRASAQRDVKRHVATEWQLPIADVEHVDAVREDPVWRVLDVRSAPRYRGETEPIDPIAGHIPGAVNLPFADNLDGARFKPPHSLRSQYQHLLGDLPPERLIVHCGSGVTACHTLLALDAAGLHGASLYVGSWSEWCRNALPRGSVDKND